MSWFESEGDPGAVRSGIGNGEAVSMAKARILAVDDQRYFRELIAGMLAEEGFEVGPRHVASVRFWQGMGLAARFPETARIQLPADGSPIEPGFRLVQKDKAQTLREIAAGGAATSPGRYRSRSRCGVPRTS